MFVSSSTVCAESERWTPPPPKRTTLKLELISVYSASKLTMGDLVSTIAHTHGRTAYILRFANVAKPQLGGTVIMDLVLKLHGDLESLTILENGHNEYDFM